MARAAQQEWKKYRIKELGRVVTGRTPPTANIAYFGNDYPFITPSDMDGRKTIRATARGLSADGGRLLRSCRVPENSIAVSCIGWQMGKVVITGTVCYTNQQLNTIIPNESVDSQFLYYSLSTRRDELKTLGSVGTRTPILKKSAFEDLWVDLPSLPVQREIATILSAYDNLIENNTRRITILEEMAQAIYHEWFVHFRFPGHDKVKLVDSSVGRIPSGWDAGQLSDALVLQRGFDLPSTERRAGTVPVYAATGVVGTHDEGKVRGPGVVTGRSGSLGTVIYIDEDFWPLNTTLWVKEFRRATPAYAFYLLRGLALGSFNSGAAVPTLNRNDIHGLPIVIPPVAVLERFDQHIAAFFCMKRNLAERNTKLECARNLLLPRLVAGEIEMDVSADSL